MRKPLWLAIGFAIVIISGTLPVHIIIHFRSTTKFIWKVFGLETWKRSKYRISGVANVTINNEKTQKCVRFDTGPWRWMRLRIMEACVGSNLVKRA